MQYIIAGLLVVVAGLLAAIYFHLSDLATVLRDAEEEVRQLRIHSRARVSRAAVQSGAATEEQSLVRLGRASVGRRVVIGGDPDSHLNQQLTTLTQEADDARG